MTFGNDMWSQLKKILKETCLFCSSPSCDEHNMQRISNGQLNKNQSIPFFVQFAEKRTECWACTEKILGINFMFWFFLCEMVVDARVDTNTSRNGITESRSSLSVFENHSRRHNIFFCNSQSCEVTHGTLRPHSSWSWPKFRKQSNASFQQEPFLRLSKPSAQNLYHICFRQEWWETRKRRKREGEIGCGKETKGSHQSAHRLISSSAKLRRLLAQHGQTSRYW